MADNSLKNVNQPDGLRGSVKIADDVILCIAALAATDVEGVASMAGNITNDLVSMFGVKNLRRGVKINMEEEEVQIDLSIIVEYGYSIPAVSARVQEKVRNTIENMTGFNVSEVNVSIAGIDTRTVE
ncbi:MAG: Asp23/Gls24 family envelope stress response protein [Lachnospiraceae bacterium]|nr:Asp23/Gls24 family envelope stress response protein [Lachnospiraceae bacterium]MBR2531599.1 Asp23/Gls24 family envelope stress response protein [Lachnospiraceae bacterium]